MKPKVSVIVPTYNCESYIGATLDSLLAQTLPGVQIICVDDCSTDKTPEIIAQKARQNENIVFIRLPQNRG
ncbi:MAG: glycosyltransferase, partial [Opitutales bacterium]|nr:glycosyltransferase [Opitutales bacterium]